MGGRRRGRGEASEKKANVEKDVNGENRGVPRGETSAV